jgi:hypothetical protein
MELYLMTTAEKAAMIAQDGLQDDDVHILGEGFGVQLYDIRPGPDGGALLKSRRVDASDEGVEVTPGPLLLMSWDPPELWRWFRVCLGLPDEEVDRFRVIEEETPQGLSPEEFNQYLQDVNEGRIPPGNSIDWGYKEYMIPLDVLRVHARLEGPFTCDAETGDLILESTAELGGDFELRIEANPDENT